MYLRNSWSRVLLGATLLMAASCKPSNNDLLIDAAAPLPSAALVITPWNQGNGFLLDREDRLVVTSAQVVGAHEEADVLFAALEDGKAKSRRDYYLKQAPRLKGKVVATDPLRDLAVLQLPSVPADIQELKLAAVAAQPDEPAHLAVDPGSKSQSWASRDSTVVSVGPQSVVSGAGQKTEGGMVELKLDGKYAKAIGGGPVVNDSGELIGVVVANSAAKSHLFGMEAAELKHFLGTAYRKLAAKAFAKTEYAQAVAYSDKALRYAPGDALTHNERGAALSYLNRYDEAIAAYTAALKAEPRLARAYRNRGSARYYKGQYDEAVADCTQAIRLDPKYVAAYQTRSQAYQKLNKGEAAKADQETIQELTKPVFKAVDP